MHAWVDDAGEDRDVRMLGERTELLITTVEDTNKSNVARRPSVRFKIDKGDKFPPERNTWRPNSGLSGSGLGLGGRCPRG